MLHSIFQQIWKSLQWPQDWKKSVFIPIPKKSNAKKYSNYWIITLISHASKFSSVQSLSCVWLFATPWNTARQASLSITNTQSSPKLMCIELVMPSSDLILCRPLFLLPPIPPSTRVFSNESALWMRWPKYWSFSFGISPSSVYSGLISFRIGWLELLAVQRTLKSFSPAPQFWNFSSSAFSLFYGLTLTSIHDNWKNHSFDYTDLCRKNDVFAF